MKSNKIKKVTLDCFRAFPDKVVLDFEKEDVISDIIVIYAPNGTGKTSTIEGIEWATTGKISRISNIINNNPAKNRNPKEGYILKNRQSSASFASVSIELDSGEYITRHTKPKGNRNNDYCSGTFDATIEYLDSFGANILSQGNINKFSYEASNGGLFNSLISSKDNSDDIQLYEELNLLKTRSESAITDKKAEIVLLKNLILNEVNKLSDKKSANVENLSIENNEYYTTFKDKFTIFQDLSHKDIDAKISYLNTSIPVLQSIKQKIIEFDINSYRRIVNRVYVLKKAINYEKEITQVQNVVDDHRRKLNENERELQNLDKYMNEINISRFNSIVNEYKKLTSLTEINKNLGFKLSYVYNSIRNRMALINIESIKDSDDKISQVESILSSLFYDSSPSDVVIEGESTFIESIDVELTAAKTQLALLSRDVFISLNPEITEVKDLNIQTLELEKINNNLTKFFEEKERFKSFEGRIGIIKSSIIDIVTEHGLKDCPSCGNNFSDMASLLYAINTINMGSGDLFNDVIADYNNKKVNVSNEINRLEKEIESIISIKKVDLNERITYLSNKKQRAIIFYSLISTLDIDFVSVKLKDVISSLATKKKVLNSNLSISLRKIEKYGRWLNGFNKKLVEVDGYTSQNKSKIEKLMSDCFETFGESIDVVTYKFGFGHVNLFEKNKLKISKGILQRIYDDNVTYLIHLNSIISELRVLGGFSLALDFNKALEIEIIAKKKFRSNYNFICSNIKGFNVNNGRKFSDIITSLESLFYSFNQYLQAERDLLESQNLLDNYNEQLSSKENELKKHSDNLICLNVALSDALDYFSELASNSINNDILNDMFMYIEPHLKYDKIKFKVDLSGSNKGIYIQAHSSENNESTTPVYYLSEAQINILSICIFLADHARKIEKGINSIIIDDPVQSMDDLNSYALIDLCKLFARRFDKQIIITTHNRNFYNLFKEKLPESRYATKYISL